MYYVVQIQKRQKTADPEFIPLNNCILNVPEYVTFWRNNFENIF